uniref:Killer cell lectin-like receptor subfamily B member 1B allele C isoform X1 n=1 Tax=Pogona vitticeps TaxID=103695 RepID=A0ABM5FIK0_9SAUR
MKREAHLARALCKVEDAPCYYNFRPRGKPEAPKDESKLQALIDILLRHPRRLRCLLGSGCAIILLLVGAIIALGVWGISFKAWQTKESLDALEDPHAVQESNCSQGCNHGTQQTSHNDFQALLQFLCKLHDNDPSETSKCKLCPENWRRHENKCYWISKEKQTWNVSQDDCTGKVSHLAVIQKKEELDFIQQITDGAQLLWIGLTVVPHTQEWAWVEGSLFNDTLLPVTEAAEINSCGMLKGSKVISDACTAVANWICEKEAFLV